MGGLLGPTKIMMFLSVDGCLIRFLSTISMTTMAVSGVTIGCIAYDRYLYVKSVADYNEKKTQRVIVILLLLPWTMPLVLFASKQASQVINTFLVLMLVLTIYVFIIYCYVKLMKFLKMHSVIQLEQQQQQLQQLEQCQQYLQLPPQQQQTTQTTTSTTITITNLQRPQQQHQQSQQQSKQQQQKRQNHHLTHNKRNQKMVQFIRLILVAAIVFTFPIVLHRCFEIIDIYKKYKGQESWLFFERNKGIVRNLAHCSYILNSCINPILYFSKHQSFRRAFRKCFKGDNRVHFMPNPPECG